MTSMPRQTDYAFVFQFSDFRAVDGVMHFTRVHVSSNCDEMITIELSDFKPGAKFEANTFDKP
ncbi:MAG: hypothetical protein ACJ8F7_19315 [Gemmataceae bacterium]